MKIKKLKLETKDICAVQDELDRALGNEVGYGLWEQDLYLMPNNTLTRTILAENRIEVHFANRYWIVIKNEDIPIWCDMEDINPYHFIDYITDKDFEC